MPKPRNFAAGKVKNAGKDQFYKKIKEFFKKGLQNENECVIIHLVHRGIAQLVEYWSPKPRVVGSSPSAPAKSLGRFRSDREKKRKAEISRDFSAFFAPNFFQISIDPFSIFLRVEGFELPKMLFFKN